MGLLDLFTGAASKKAARNNQAAIAQNLTAGTNALTQGTNDALGLLGTRTGGSALQSLEEGFGRARGDLGSMYGETQGYLGDAGRASQGYLREGEDQARQDLTSGYGSALGSLSDAFGQQREALGRIGALYEPMAEQGRNATNLRDDALGVNGADGNARAKAAFQGSLGYNAGLDTGLDSVMRLASARGDLAGGNTSRDLFNYGADYQNRQSGSYLDRLTQAGGSWATGLAGQAGALQGLAGAAQNYGNTSAGLYQGQGTALGGLASGLGKDQAAAAAATGAAQAGAAQNQGSALGNLGAQFGSLGAGVYGTGANLRNQQGQGIAGLNSAATGATIQNNNNLAASDNAAGANILGGILGLGQLFTGQAGKAAGAGGGGGGFSLGKLFGA